MDLNLMKRLVAQGRMSRRDFIQLSVATGLTVAAANTAFVSAARAEPKKGGRFRIAVGSGATTDTLDPALYPDTFNGIWGWASLRSSLTEVQADGSITGDAAETFEASKGATEWVFKLRKGIQFHGGKTLDADDVVVSINHHRSADSKSAAKSLLTSVTDVKADGKDTVIITLSAGNADFPYIASDYHIPLMPAKDGKADWQSGDGTGPYKMKTFEPGVRAEGARNPNYFRDTWFDEIVVLPILDVNARTNALVTGEVDYIDRVDLKTMSLLQRNDKIGIAEVSGFAHYIAPMITNVAPFDDVNVRLALKYAIDREQIVKKVLLGHGSVGNDSPIAPGMPFYADPSPKHGYDPDMAKSYLKKAGLSSLKVDLSAADAAFAGAVDAAQIMRESAAKAGIDINVIREPNDGYWDAVWMKKPWCLGYWSGRPTADLMFTTAYAEGAAWNETFWKNARFNELLGTARSELDQAKRADMYREMQQIVHDDGGAMVLMFYNYVGAHAKNVAHPDKLARNWDVDGLKITQRWWFA
ncbi:ABC transporter substrate-binding protein [Hypericibacter sp.]|uniref:ABC transporter substrate-binding protein n=1 Tax=Hypericibacter sp. TaxID=2705401 RepID=UPI003D6D7F5C